MLARDLAIDLGTATTVVWGRGQGAVLVEPTVVALHERTGGVLAVGAEACAVVVEATEPAVAERPLHGGAVADFRLTTRLLSSILRRAGARRWERLRLLLGVPGSSTGVERRAVRQVALDAGAAGVHLIEKPVAAAVGAGLPVHEPVGSMVVDVGAGTCEAAVISLGGIVASRSLRLGGLDVDAAIQDHLRSRYHLMIGECTAEAVKVSIGSAYPQVPEPAAEVRGRALATGVTEAVILGAGELREAVDPVVTQVVAAVLDTLAECPPELTHDVAERGIHLVGGGARLRGLDARIAQETEIPVRLLDVPAHPVAAGAGAVLEAFGDLRNLLLA